VCAPETAANRQALAEASILVEAQITVRTLINTPANLLGPADFAEAAHAMAAPLGIAVTILDEQALEEGGFGGILAVGRGSARPPRLVILTWSPPQATGTIALVGKGITFDSGGLSLKPGKSMETMKYDMSGAATVLGAIVAAARFALPITITAYLPLADNMPSGTAQHPGDIITVKGGGTIEVLNTDAEGRLVLADALVAAREASPDAIVDIATLTGTQVTALSDKIGAVLGSDTIREELLQAARTTGEPLWPLPLPAALRAVIDTPFADVKNTSGPQGATLTAGLFLRHFVGDTPWGHLDIAGPAYNHTEPHGHTPKGATGWGMRTLVTWCAMRARGAFPRD
jgi:leucyl aminopeptidase